MLGGKGGHEVLCGRKGNPLESDHIGLIGMFGRSGDLLSVVQGQGMSSRAEWKGNESGTMD